MIARALRAVLLALAVSITAGGPAFAQIGGPIAGGGGANGVAKITGGTITGLTGFSMASGQALLPAGTNGAPSYSFTGATGQGIYAAGGTNLTLVGPGTTLVSIVTNGLNVASTTTYGWAPSSDSTANPDVVLARDAANTIAQKSGTNAQVTRLYFSTTGPVYFQQTARTAGVLFTGTGGAMQLSTAQTTVPTCTTNCGTSPSIAGTDTAMVVTMGATGVPASGWVVTFNGTWPAAPACIVQSALSTMVVGKMPIAVQTSTTTLTVTTNGTAPATSDKYQIHCLGVS